MSAIEGKSKLFEYAILWHPTSKQIEEGGITGKSKILVEKKTILSATSENVAMAASMEIPKEYREQLDQVQIVVRPF